MAIGDQPDMLRRLRGALPSSWVPDGAPVQDALLSGTASAWSWLYQLIQFVRQQARITTASGSFLDSISQDFFCARLQRFVNEGDLQYRSRIKAELLRPRATRTAIIRALTELTGRTPKVFEPANAMDTGGYGCFGSSTGSGLFYGVLGGYGSLKHPFQCFIAAFRPAGGGIADIVGYYASSGWAGGGYGVGAIEWAGADMISGAVTDAAIEGAIAGCMPVAATAWIRIES
jgi:hypothetical protein